MHLKKTIGPILSGIGAGAVNGLLGAGGGMVLVPLLSLLTDLEEEQIFPASVSIILPVCLISLSITYQNRIVPWEQTVFYLAGSLAGGILAGVFGKKIPTLWLHRVLGILVIWGGVRYLW